MVEILLRIETRWMDPPLGRYLPLYCPTRQEPNLLCGIDVPNGTPLYSGTPPLRKSIVILSDFSHFVTKKNC